MDVFMLLEERGRDLRRYWALDRRTHDLGLVLAPGHENDSSRIKDRPHPHCDRMPRRILLSAKVARGVASRQGIEGHHPCPRAPGAARFVEADVPRAPNS